MTELREIVKAYDLAKQAGKATVLATVVHVRGSSYRRPGARMLVLQDGLMIGAISGGCLEGDALKKALLTFSDRRTRLITYDTSDEADATVGIQLGCEGIIQVLFEYINESNPSNPIELIRKVIAKRQRGVIVTLFDLKNKQAHQLGTAHIFEEAELSQLPEALKAFPADVLVQSIEPVISLVIVGAGNDAIPLMQMATILGWEVKVVDGRNTHAKQDRFINACQVLVSKPEKVLAQIEIDNRTCFVLMTHNYQYDLQMLKALLPIDTPYIGLLGPKKKFNRIIEDLQKEGIVPTSEQLAKVYGPTGLDIGAETSDEIAVSIIAEIQAVMNGRDGIMLKLKPTQIHSK
jgi:xanthine dehydrogenase accessory factor